MPIQMPPVENGVETLEMISARFSVQRARLDAATSSFDRWHGEWLQRQSAIDEALVRLREVASRVPSRSAY